MHFFMILSCMKMGRMKCGQNFMEIMESYNFCDDDETFYHDVKDIERYLKTADLEFIF